MIKDRIYLIKSISNMLNKVVENKDYNTIDTIDEIEQYIEIARQEGREEIYKKFNITSRIFKD